MSTSRPVPAGVYTAASWSSGPERVYDAMAGELLRHLRVPVAGGLVLDLGAGTGVVSRRLRALGARPTAVDVEVGMLTAVAGALRVVADGRRLPFPAACFDAVVAACAVSHVPDPEVMLREAYRVTRPGGAVVASVIAAGDAHPAKVAVDDALRAHGHVPPAWYADLKEREDLLGTPAGMARVAEAAGLATVEVTVREVDPGLDSAAVVAWRLGMAGAAPFVASLSDDRRLALRTDAERAVAATGQRPTVRLLVLSSVVRT